MENKEKLDNTGLVTRDKLIPDWYELEFNEHAVEKVLSGRACSGYVKTPEKFIEGDYYIKLHLVGNYRLQICPHVVAHDLNLIFDAYHRPEAMDITRKVRNKMLKETIPCPFATVSNRNYYRYFKILKTLITNDVEIGVYSSKHSITQLIMSLLIDSVMKYMEMIARYNPVAVSTLTAEINKNKEMLARLISDAKDYDEKYVGEDYNIKNMYTLLLRLNAKIPEIKVLDEITDIIAKCIHSVHKSGDNNEK